MSGPNQKKNIQQVNLQDTVLNEVRKNRIKIKVFFVNGFQMEGIVKSFDNFTIFLVDSNKEYLLYKHAITTIQPLKPLKSLNLEL